MQEFRPPTPFHDEDGASRGWLELERGGFKFHAQERPSVAAGAADTPDRVHAESSLVVEHVRSGVRLAFSAQGALAQAASSRAPFFAAYPGELSVDPERRRAVLARERAIEAGDFGRLVPSRTAIPMDKLLQQGYVHLYANVLLFEASRTDGQVRLDVRLRVMDDMWLVLLRYYALADGKVTMHDVRYYASTDAPEVILQDEETREMAVGALAETAAHSRPPTASMRAADVADPRFYLKPDNVWHLVSPSLRKQQEIPLVP